MLTVSDYNDVDSAERADSERAQADGYTPSERLQWSDARTCYVDDRKPSACANIRPRLTAGDCFSHHSD